jgi:uncharacterized RDD family membrane protein YckC
MAEGWRRFARPGDPTRVLARRCLAFVVDATVVVLVLFLATRVTPGSIDSGSSCPVPVPKGKACFDYEDAAYVIDGADVIRFVIVVAVLLTAVLLVFRRVVGTTLGKWLFRVRVVDALGHPVSRWSSLLRSVCLPVDLLFVVLPIGLWLAILTPGHRRLGDFLGKSWVVRAAAVGRPPFPPGDP